MHFGVFVLGTGNHSAGWRYDGAATSNNDLSVIQEIARHAERAATGASARQTRASLSRLLDRVRNPATSLN
jgi:hypothetical protein